MKRRENYKHCLFNNIKFVQLDSRFQTTYLWNIINLLSVFNKDKEASFSSGFLYIINSSLIWRRRHHRWTAAKVWPVLGIYGLLAERGLYRAIPAVTFSLGFCGLIRMYSSILVTIYDKQKEPRACFIEFIANRFHF